MESPHKGKTGLVRLRNALGYSLAGFRAAEVVLATGGDGAVLRGMDGSVGLLLPLADGWIARRLPPSALDWTGGGLVARLDEPMMRRATLDLPARPDWLAA